MDAQMPSNTIDDHLHFLTNMLIYYYGKHLGLKTSWVTDVLTLD